MTEEGAVAAGSPESGGSPEGSPGGSAQTGMPDWGTLKASLGDLGKDKSLEPYKDLQGLVKSHIEGQKMIGNSIRLPSKDAKPEDRTKAVNDILGRLRKEGVLEVIPEAPEKYDIKMPEMEGWAANEPLVTSFRQIAHKLELPPSKAQGLFDWYLNFQQEAEAQQQAEFDTMKAAMKKEMGGLYTRKMEAARRAVAKYLGEDGDEIISNLPPQVGRKLVLAFSEIGDPLLEDALVGGELPGVKTLNDTEQKVNAIVSDRKHPLWDVSHPGHAKAVEEWSNLQQIIKLKGKK
jgi:hypothetical protein